MGCISSSLSQDDEFSQIGGSAFAHHIVSLTSTTYGLLTLDPPPSPPPTSTVPPTPEPPPPRRTLCPDHISTFRFSLPSKPNSEPNEKPPSPNVATLFRQPDDFLRQFEPICPPNGENKAVMYSTTLRGVRKTFEDCNAVRSAIQGLGFFVCERDISMDRGFRDELRELLKGKGSPDESIPPRLFVKGRYIGGVEDVMTLVEEGDVRKLFHGLPESRGGCVCEGCGGVGFLTCFACHGSCKTVKEESGLGRKSDVVVVRCDECNENGLVLCPTCS